MQRPGRVHAGRQIAEQARLRGIEVDYAEYTEGNGMIVALDQEKAENLRIGGHMQHTRALAHARAA